MSDGLVSCSSRDVAKGFSIFGNSERSICDRVWNLTSEKFLLDTIKLLAKSLKVCNLFI